MSEPAETTPFTEAFAKPGAMLRVPMGLASPLWGLFAGAAMSGTAWWWMTRWTQAQNLEALFGAPADAAAEAPAPEALPEPAEAIAEAEAAVEAIIEPPVLDAPVGGESAPIGPAVVVAPDAEPPAAPKPRPKKAAPKPE